MKRALKIVLALVVLVLVAGQIAPFPAAENPPVETQVPAPPEVLSILRTSCYDCHSNETVWPWYSRVVPTKWLVRNHVAEGRGHVNFSTWNRYDPGRAARRLEGVAEVVEEGEMPLKSYTWLHEGAGLTDEEAAILIRWARGATGGEAAGGS